MRATSIFLGFLGAIASLLVMAAAVPAWAEDGQAMLESVTPAPKPPSPQTAKTADVTLIGRGNQAAEITRDGKVTALAPGSLVFRNRGRMPAAVAPAPVAPPTVAEEAAEEAARAAAKEAVEEALVEADRASIKKMREGRYMWFFDENGKQMTNEELDRRVAEGNFKGMKAMNDDRVEWKPGSGGPAEEEVGGQAGDSTEVSQKEKKDWREPAAERK